MLRRAQSNWYGLLVELANARQTREVHSLAPRPAPQSHSLTVPPHSLCAEAGGHMPVCEPPPPPFACARHTRLSHRQPSARPATQQTHRVRAELLQLLQRKVGLGDVARRAVPPDHELLARVGDDVAAEVLPARAQPLPDIPAQPVESFARSAASGREVGKRCAPRHCVDEAALVLSAAVGRGSGQSGRESRARSALTQGAKKWQSGMARGVSPTAGQPPCQTLCKDVQPEAPHHNFL